MKLEPGGYKANFVHNVLQDFEKRIQQLEEEVEQQDELLRLAYEYVEDPEDSPVTLNEVWLKLKGHFGE